MSVGSEGENLIYIISQPRAGSTLLQRVLSSHPEISTTQEPWIMLFLQYIRQCEIETSDFKGKTANKAINDFINLLPDADNTYIKATANMARYLYNEFCSAQNSRYFLDKTPTYYFIIPQLIKAFPKALFIILLRNPLAVLNSILNTWVTGEWYRLPRHYHNLLTAPKKITEGIQLLGNSAYIVHYEDLVKNPEDTVEHIFHRIGLRFSPEFLKYGVYKKPKGRMGDPTGIHKDIQPNVHSLEQWHQLGHDEELRDLATDYINSLGEEIVQKMGYDKNEIQNKLFSFTCKKRYIKVSWENAMIPNPGYSTTLYLLIIEFFQKREFFHTSKQLLMAIFNKL